MTCATHKMMEEGDENTVKEYHKDEGIQEVKRMAEVMSECVKKE